MNPCFDRITEAMQAPSFYPQPVDKVQMAETHISMIFLTGVKVYKVKKPLKLDFLDFSTLDQRRRYCHDEVRLNRRLSADVYLGVSAVTAEEDGFALDGPGTVVEYAVCMRQLPRDRTLEQLLPAGGIASGALDLLARRLVSFYQDSATGGAIDAMGTTEAIAGNCLENLEQTAPFTGRLLAPDSHEQVHVATESFLRQHRHRFAKRIRAARIREGHGDLRPDHVYFTEMGIQIIDCIEFNERFRYLDTVCDLAFLLMEIDRMGYPWAADTLLRAYLEHADDLQAFHLVTFYKCYRAMVRVKVNCLRLDQKDLGPAEHDALVAQTEAYLSLARDYTEIFNRPAVFVVCGVIATGKSTLADALADTLDLEHFHSDRIRQTMVSSNGPLPLGEGKYAPETTDRVYERLRLHAQQALIRNQSVILDATYGSRRKREALREMVCSHQARVAFVECTCRESEIKRRLEEREKASHPMSDARIQHLKPLKAGFEPLEEVARHRHIRVDTEQPVRKNICAVLAQFA